MGTTHTKGFTIIEVMLVLAITGLMLLGILVGVGVQINRQEYRSSVVSLQSEVQKQFSLVQNPINNRTPSAACGQSDDTSSDRGAASHCLILGRLLVSNEGVIDEYPVLGSTSGSKLTAPVVSGGSWQLRVDDNQKETYEVTWGSQIKAGTATVGQKPALQKNFALMIIMSPADGVLHTYRVAQTTTYDISPKGLSSLLAMGNDTKALTLCLQNGYSSSIGTPLGVRIDSDAANSTGVTIPSQSEGVC